MEKPRRVWGPGLLAPPDATAERGVSAKPAGGMGVPRPKAISSPMCLWRNSLREAANEGGGAHGLDEVALEIL